jgi:hypothetical protein
VAEQVVNPFFTGGEVISVSYPHESMSHADKLSSVRPAPRPQRKPSASVGVII